MSIGTFADEEYGKIERAIDNDFDIERIIEAALNAGAGATNVLADFIVEKIREVITPALRRVIRLAFIENRHVLARWTGHFLIVGLDALSSVINTILLFATKALSSAIFWDSVMKITVRVWNENEDRGRFAQVYNTGRVFVMSLLHAMKIVFVKAIDAENLNLSDEDKALLENAIEIALDNTAVMTTRETAQIQQN